MSKTVDDLIMVFEKARAEAAPFPQHHEDGLYAGIAAVVRALRPKLVLWFHAIDQNVTEKTAAKFADDFINEILGAAGDEKVGTHGSPELVQIFISANDIPPGTLSPRTTPEERLERRMAACRAGIAAVVRAVAPDDDEIAAYNRLSYKVQEQLKCECEYLPEDRCIRCSVVDALKCLETRYCEILGDAGNEKVAGVTGLDSVGAGLSPAPGQTPATDPAPAVCVWKRVEWTPLMSAHWEAECSNRAMWSPDWARCPNCKAPIKFTEAQR